MWNLYPFRGSSRTCTNPLSRCPPLPCPVLCNTHRTITIHDTRFAHLQHKREFAVQISSWARITTLVHHRQSADRRVYVFLAAATTSAPPPALAHVYTSSVSSSQCYIVVPRHSGSDIKLAVSPMYVELLRDEASKHVFIAGILDCGADMGGGSCPASRTPC